MAKKYNYKKKSKKKNKSIYSTIIIVIFIIFGFLNNNSKNSNSNLSNSNNQTGIIKKAKIANNDFGGLSKDDYQKLANLDFQSGNTSFLYVNNNKSTLIKDSWKLNKVIYSDLDSLNRTANSNTAFLEQRNVANDSLRVRQFINPTGWHSNKQNGVQIYNRGHLIAYSISAGIDQDGNYNPNNQSGDQNNPKNLFTQSAYSNQKIQTIYESKVRNALKKGDRLIYQATPIFRGTELMARGINLQAISENNDLNFNVYIFNIQPEYVFDYSNGRAKVDKNMKIA